MHMKVIVKGRNCNPRSLLFSRGKAKGQGQHLITPQKKLPLLTYFTILTNIIRSHKKRNEVGKGLQPMTRSTFL